MYEVVDELRGLLNLSAVVVQTLVNVFKLLNELRRHTFSLLGYLNQFSEIH